MAGATAAAAGATGTDAGLVVKSVVCAPGVGGEGQGSDKTGSLLSALASAWLATIHH